MVEHASLRRARVPPVRARSRARPTWGIAAIALGVCVGAAVGFEGTVVKAVLAVALVAVLVAVGSAQQSPAPRAVAIERVALDPGTATPARAATDDRLRRGLWVGTVLTLLIVALDTQGYTLGPTPGVRYGLLAIPLFALLGAAAATHGSRLDQMTASDRFLAVLAVGGLIGSLYGRKFLGTSDSATVIFLPMCLGLTHLLVRDPLPGVDAVRYQRALVRVGVVFLVFAVLARTSVWPLGLPTHVAHERSLFVAMGFAGALLSRRYAVLAGSGALAVVMFFQYPAATWLVVVMAAVATGFATSRRGRRSAALVLIVFAFGVLGFGFTQVQHGRSSVGKDYFSSVGKGDNTDTRSQLWKAAELKIKKSPFVGSLFTGDFTVSNVNQVISNRGATQTIEPHNDYLEIMLLGGLLGLFLFAAFIVSTNVIVIRRVHRLSDDGDRSQSSLARVLLIAFNVALAGAFFNPELSQLGITASIFLIYSLMMTVRPRAGIAQDDARGFRAATGSGGRA